MVGPNDVFRHAHIVIAYISCAIPAFVTKMYYGFTCSHWTLQSALGLALRVHDRTHDSTYTICSYTMRTLTALQGAHESVAGRDPASPNALRLWV